MLRNNTIFMQNRILYKFLFFGKIDEHDTCIIMLLLTERNVAANCDAMKRTQTVLFWWRYMRYGKERWMCMVQCAVCKMPLREMIWEFVCHSRICRWAGETVALGRHIYILWRRRHWTIYTVIWHTIRKSSCFWPICIIFNLRLHLNSTFEFIYIFFSFFFNFFATYIWRWASLNPLARNWEDVDWIPRISVWCRRLQAMGKMSMLMSPFGSTQCGRSANL